MKTPVRALLTGVAGLGLALGAPSQAAAQVDNVTITKHNLSATTNVAGLPAGATITDYGEVCVYCHTPHGGQESAPLWNREFSVASYDMYDDTWSASIDMTVDGTPTGVSMACLSCHDGTIGLDVISNAPNTFSGSIPGTTLSGAGANVMPTTGFTYLGTSLRNDHPISVEYDPTADTQFNTVASIKAAGIKLFTNDGGTAEKVQCASCHNPHESDAAYAPFLRIANAGSALCKTCHIK